MKKVFISRNLKPNSVFRQLLENEGFEVFGKSLIDFKAIDFDLPEKVDWVFFYSKNGVRFFLEKVDINYFENIKIGAIGEGTAAFLKQQNLSPDFIGNGKPKDTARQFSKMVNCANVLFARAKNSNKSVQGLLNDSIHIYDVAVYENTPKTDLQIAYFDVLVFTSSMNAITYFKHKQLTENQLVVAIGEPTAFTIQRLGIEVVLIAKIPSEVGLANAILSHY